MMEEEKSKDEIESDNESDINIEEVAELVKEQENEIKLKNEEIETMKITIATLNQNLEEIKNDTIGIQKSEELKEVTLKLEIENTKLKDKLEMLEGVKDRLENLIKEKRKLDELVKELGEVIEKLDNTIEEYK